MMRSIIPNLGLALVLAIVTTTSASEPDDFGRDVRPVLEQYCLKCHGERKPRAGINLSRFKDDDAIKKDPDLWLQIIDVLNERTMPPTGKPAPNEDERQKVVHGIQGLLDAIEGVRDPGPALIQRLTRVQYNNTIRDLLGVDTHPADAFPNDGGGGAGFDNNASTLFVPPILMERYLAAAAEVLDQADPNRILIAKPGADRSKKDAARLCLQRFAEQAFRRPITELEIDRLMQLFDRADQRGDSFESAVKLALRAVLVSPNFLFLIEQTQDVEGAYRVSDYELASRLSYFLWSSMPDRELFDLAASGTLHEPKVLDRQVRRMLADPKSRALAENFAGQWLRVNTLDTSAEPDRRLYPEYTPELREAMVEETVSFFHALLRDDAPVFDLIDADYTYLNERLAKHYGIDNVNGSEFRRVSLDDPNRGGVLGMAAVLTLTSYPRRTSPVLRGKWVLEEILGTPAPPPPPNIKTLPQDDRPRDGQTFRQRLEQHRSDPNCTSCHAKMDPLGFGLENFDAIGRWRDEIAGQKVDASGVLTTGEKFETASALKSILKEQKSELFLRNLTRKMLSYSLRRGLEYYDAPAVKAIIGNLEASDYRTTSLVAEVVKSFPFQYRRNEPLTGAE